MVVNRYYLLASINKRLFFGFRRPSKIKTIEGKVDFLLNSKVPQYRIIKDKLTALCPYASSIRRQYGSYLSLKERT